MQGRGPEEVGKLFILARTKPCFREESLEARSRSPSVLEKIRRAEFSQEQRKPANVSMEFGIFLTTLQLHSHVSLAIPS